MIRFGLVGFGAIGTMRARALRRTPGAQLRVVADPVPERRAEAATRFGVRAAAGAEELLRSDDIDAVIVSTPPNMHRDQCLMALEAGKHVLCEKPLATTVEDCRRLVEAAGVHGLTLGTGFNYRFYPAVTKARKLVAEGRIGQLDHVKGFAGHPGGPEFTHPWVHDATIMGGGALMDNGIHVADLTLHFLGEVAERHRYGSENVWGFRGSEDNGYVLMRTAAGAVGVLHASWTEWPGYRISVEIYGTRGCVQVRYPPMVTIFHERPLGSAKRGRRKVFVFPVFQVLERLRSYRWTVEESFVAEQDDFMGRIAGGRGVGGTGLDGLRAVELVLSHGAGDG